jgi:hypothetical protein
MNFDDGIERAYALLSGTEDLPGHASAAQHDALGAWRTLVPARTRPLRVASRPGEIDVSRDRRSVLVKLHGSLGRHPDGVTLPLGPVTDEPDAGDLGAERGAAIDALVAVGFIIVTGYSGADLASRVALLDRLSPGRFWWVTPQVDPSVRELVQAIDPDEPRTGTAVEAIRAWLPCAPPDWPSAATLDRSFADRLSQWGDVLPPETAAEAYAWALADAGLADAGVTILRRLVAAGAGDRTRIRLADALMQRRTSDDVVEGRRLMRRIAMRRGERRLGRYARDRWVETGGLRPGARNGIGRLLLSSTFLVADALDGRRDGRLGHGATVRATAVSIGTLLDSVERSLPRAAGVHVPSRAMRRAVRLAAGRARRVLVASRGQASGRRRARLERQLIELELVEAFLDQREPELDLGGSLERLSALFEHVGDRTGLAETIGTQALCAVVSGDRQRADSALRLSSTQPTEDVGVARLARSLRATMDPDADGAIEPHHHVAVGSIVSAGTVSTTSSSTASSVPSRSSSSAP